ncbi:hypothetical protein I79_003181 [Cricetulus griseus]|uniref:Uncharacterized protein n=1 Tax=Cricetulus griseus TaxID=10029 RepID=G3GZC0_CRIGR|nr:hypothetical protein I79_003181 [Cricetulus griseus]
MFTPVSSETSCVTARRREENSSKFWCSIFNDFGDWGLHIDFPNFENYLIELQNYSTLFSHS